jgi:acetate kinase
MPPVAQTYAIPAEYTREGVIRYGFHGLSYEYIVYELAKLGQSGDRVIAAHLGSGASMAAILDGKSIDTTMGFTPAAGLVMSTRSGDLDPGIFTYMAQEKKLSAQTVSHILNEQSGLLGVSGSTSDMKELLDREKTDPNSALAVEMFCYVARKFVGAYTAALGGIDCLVFAGGIGENAPEIRERICTGLGFLGIELDADANKANAPVISSAKGRVVVRVIKTDEELMIARHTKNIVAGGTK